MIIIYFLMGAYIVVFKCAQNMCCVSIVSVETRTGVSWCAVWEGLREAAVRRESDVNILMYRNGNIVRACLPGDVNDVINNLCQNKTLVVLFCLLTLNPLNPKT